MSEATEQCPALLPGYSEHSIPAECLVVCGERIDEAFKNPDPDYDTFHTPDSTKTFLGCDNHGLDYTDGFALQAIDTAIRVIDSLDMCEKCGHDYGNQSYEFQCALSELTPPEVADEWQLTIF